MSAGVPVQAHVGRQYNTNDDVGTMQVDEAEHSVEWAYFFVFLEMGCRDVTLPTTVHRGSLSFGPDNLSALVLRRV